MACASCSSSSNSSSSKVTLDWRSEPVAQEGWWAVYAPRSWSTGPMDLGGGLEAVAGIGLLDATEMAKFDSEGRNSGSGDASSTRMGREAGEDRIIVGYKDRDSSTWSMSWDDFMKKYWGYYDGGSSSGQGGGGTTSTGDNPSTSGSGTGSTSSGTGTTSSDNSDGDLDPLVWDPNYWYAQWALLSCEQLGNREELTVRFSERMGFVVPSPDARTAYFMYKMLYARWTAANDLCCDRHCDCCNPLHT